MNVQPLPTRGDNSSMTRINSNAAAAVAPRAAAARPTTFKFEMLGGENDSELAFLKSAAFRANVDVRMDNLGKPHGVLTNWGITVSGTPADLKQLNAILKAGDRTRTYTLSPSGFTSDFKPGVMQRLMRDGVA